MYKASLVIAFLCIFVVMGTAVVGQSLEQRILPKVVVQIPPDIIVNTTSDVADYGRGDVGDLPGLDGLVSLREAITAANSTAGDQVIGFNIPISDSGFSGTVFTIKPIGEGLPPLFDNGTTIDGTFQTKSTGNTNLFGPEIVLDGSAAGESFGIITIDSSNNTIRGLVIHSFGATGIQLGSDNNKVAQCYIGTDETGTVAKGNGGQGIAITGDNHIIGGLDPADGNLISGNCTITCSSEIQIGDPHPDTLSINTVIQGNLIGTDRTGTVGLGADSGSYHINGISLINASNCLVMRNLISGNSGGGINITGPNSEGNRIEQNLIGTDITGTNPLSNSQGVWLWRDAKNNIIRCNLISGNGGDGVNIEGFNSEGNYFIENLIGTDISGIYPLPNRYNGVSIWGNAKNNIMKNNRIAFNVNNGVGIEPGSTGIRISRNSIFSNGILGIDLEFDYTVNQNDPGDIDTGANNLQNFPVLTHALVTPVRLIVKGTIDTPSPRTVTIEFFATELSGDPSGHGEGAVYLGRVRPNREGGFIASLRRVNPGTLITATATDANGNTSEFSKNIKTTSPAQK